MNHFANAAFLEGATGWSATGSGTVLSKDEARRGSAGRAVLVGTATSTASDQVFGLRTNIAAMPAITAARLELNFGCAAFVAQGEAQPAASLVFFDSSGDALMVVPVALKRPFIEVWGLARLGLMASFWTGHAFVDRPSNAVRAALAVSGTSTAAAQSIEVALLKPYLAPARPDGRAGVFNPGLHTGVDLSLAAWPEVLRDVEISSGAEPNPSLIEFAAGSGSPQTRRVSSDPARKLKARVRCDALQRAVLEEFARTEDRWWMVEPDSERLCVAKWAADGQPRLVEVRGATQHMELTFWLETA